MEGDSVGAGRVVSSRLFPLFHFSDDNFRLLLVTDPEHVNGRVQTELVCSIAKRAFPLSDTGFGCEGTRITIGKDPC